MSCETISWNDCGQNYSDGAKPTQWKYSKKKKDSASEGAPEPSQAVCWSSPVLITGRIQEKELLPGRMGMTSALLLVQLSLEGLDC